MSTKIDKELKKAISSVNLTLFRYEKDYISTLRSPNADKERCTSFEQFVETRFNYECSKIPELEDLIIKTEGRLFSCTELEEPDTAKRRFKLATICVIDPKTLPEENETLKNEITEIIKLLGCTKFKFNSVPKKIKLIKYD